MVRCMPHRENGVTTPPPRALARPPAYGNERGRRPGKIGVHMPDNRHHAIEYRKLYPAQSFSLQQLTVSSQPGYVARLKAKRCSKTNPAAIILLVSSCFVYLRKWPSMRSKLPNAAGPCGTRIIARPPGRRAE